MRALLPTRQAATAGILVALLAGCSTTEGAKEGSPDDHHVDTTTSNRELCDRLLGKTGGDALTELTGSDRAIPLGGRSQHHDRTVARGMRLASPSEVSGGKERLRSVCTFKTPPTDARGPRFRVNMEYGWSRHPKKTNADYSFFYAGSALVDINFKDRLQPDNIYFTCRTPSGKKGIVRGHANGGWLVSKSAEEASRNYARVLMASASSMSESIGCTNSPDLSPTAELKGFGGHFVNTPPGLSLPSPPASGPVKP